MKKKVVPLSERGIDMLRSHEIYHFFSDFTLLLWSTRNAKDNGGHKDEGQQPVQTWAAIPGQCLECS